MNTTTVNGQRTYEESPQAVATDANGNFVVTWSSFQDGSLYGVYAQRYNAAGGALGSEIRVNSHTSSFQFRSAVAMDADGDFVITWTSAAQDGSQYGVYAQRFGAAGTPAGPEFRVNTATALNQKDSSIAMDANGNFVITWTSTTQDGSSDGIFGQRYTAAGSPVGNEFQVNTFTTGKQAGAVVAMDSDGDFVVTWTSTNQDGSAEGIYARRFNANGSSFGSEFRVNTVTASRQNDSHVAMDADGDFVIAWSSVSQDGNFDGVFAQRYTANITPQGSEFLVNVVTTNDQRGAAVAMDSDGDFIVTWLSQAQDGSGTGIYARRFNAAGVPVDHEFRVNSFTTGNQQYQSVDVDATGNFVVVWTSPSQDGSANGVFAQRYSSVVISENAPVITSNGGGATASINVPENTGSVTTVTATDIDAGAAIRYSISGGADASLFSIDINSGVLTFRSNPDFEAPSDADADNIYLVQVRAFDGSLEDTQNLAVTVTDVGETTPTITSNGGGATANITINENISVVTTVQATDPDVPVVIPTYAISGGADANLFSINSSTGVLRFKSLPDYETPLDAGTDNVYNVQVQASDGLLADTQDLTIFVADVFEFVTTYPNEQAEDKAFRTDNSFRTFALPRDDDGSSILAEDIGFTINFYGRSFSQLFVNNNGNVTFDNPLSTFTPNPIVANSQIIMAPFWADVDTNNLLSEVTRWGQGTVDGHRAFGVNWENVGYFNSHADRLNKFQLVIIEREDLTPGDFDFEFNYDQVQWETGDVSGGSGGLGGSSARVGYSNGTTASFELTGSAINGALIDGGPNSLVANRFNSIVNGRYRFGVRGGVVVPEADLTDNTTSTTVIDGVTNVDFGPVITGSSASRTFTLRNVGDTNLTVSPAIRTGPFTITSNFPIGTSIPPGGSRSFTVQFTAGTIGTFNGTVSFNNNDSDESPFNFNLTARSVATAEPEIFVQTGPTEVVDGGDLLFGTSFVGVPVTRKLRISNFGNTDLVVQPISITGGYTLSANFTNNQVIAAGSFVDLQVTLDATTEGLYTGQLSFFSNDSNERPFNITLNGRVFRLQQEIEIRDGATILTSSSSSVDFGNTPQGTPVSKTFTVFNLGIETLVLDPVIATGDFTVTTNFTPGRTIFPGAQATFTVQFNPASIGAKTGTITVPNNDPNEQPFVFNVAGFGANPNQPPKFVRSIGVAPVASEFRVNSGTVQDQMNPAVASDADGDSVVVWQSSIQDGNLSGIYGQRYNAQGVPQGSEFLVNVITTGDQIQPAVAMDADGDFVVTWSSYTSGVLTDLFARRYNAAGVPQGPVIPVANFTLGGPASASVSMEPNGNFIVTWSNFGRDGSGFGIYAQRFTSAGDLIGSEFRVNTTFAGNQHESSVAVDDDGDFVVTWNSDAQDGSLRGIYAQRYLSTGAPAGPEFRVNSFTTGEQFNPSVAIDANGDFVIAWQSFGRDGDRYGIYAQRYNTVGLAQGTEFLVNTYTTSDQRNPVVAMTDAGDFVVSWNSNSQDGDREGVFLQFYTAAGTPMGSELRANQVTARAQAFPSVAMDADGDFTIAWSSDLQDLSNQGVYARRHKFGNVGSPFTNLVSLSENTPVPVDIRVADFAIADDGLGGQTASLSGPDAALFTLVGNSLFLKAGIVLDFEITQSYSVIVSIDDPTVGTTPDDAATFTLQIIDLDDVLSPNILVSSATGTVEELRTYAPDGTLLTTVNIPVSEAAHNARDIIADVGGLVHAFNGTTLPQMSTLNQATTVWSSLTFLDWNSTNTPSFGGIAVFGDSVFVTDNVGAAAPRGIVQFSKSGFPTVRFASALGYGFRDLTLGLNGFLYALRDTLPNATIDVFDPETRALMTSITVANSAIGYSGIAVNEEGEIFLAEESRTVLRVSPTGTTLGNVTVTALAPGETFADIDIATDGRIVLGTNRGNVVQMPEDLSSSTVFLAGSATTTVFVAFDEPQFIPNAEPPVITSNGGNSTAAINVAENSTIATTVTATDPNVGQALTFAITGGLDQAKFAINASTGVLTFLAAPDFETPTDSNTDNVYEVTVQVSDGIFNDTQAIAVTITDLGETPPPVITSDGGNATAALSVVENTTTVTTATATDPDLPPQTLTFSIIGGTDAALFTINSSSGLLEFVSPPNFEVPNDSDTDNVYNVVVQVDDGTGSFDSQAIAVTVTDINDAPVITAPGTTVTGAVTLNENVAAVTTVTATDPDLPAQTLTYSISGGPDEALFTIDSGTGALSFNTAPNFEAPADAGANNVYNITVHVSDNAGGSDTQDLTITVADLNELPVITSNGGGTTATVHVAENTNAVTTITATDQDLPAQTLTYSIVGGADAALFNINITSGALTFVAPRNFESPSDADADNIYEVSMRVSDGQGGTDQQDIFVIVDDANDAPIITSFGGQTNVLRNQIHLRTSVATLTATDPDLPAQTLTYSISGGLDASKFTVDSNTGALSFLAPPNFLLPTDSNGNNVYLVTVQVSDGNGGTDTQSFNIAVQPPDSTAPSVVSIVDDDANNQVELNQVVTYTVSFNEDIDETTVSAADFDNALGASFSITGVTETSPGVFSVTAQITSAGSFRLRIKASADVRDPSGNALAAAVLDNDTLTVDQTPPSVTAITQNDTDLINGLNQVVTYTVTFSEDLADSTLFNTRFANAGTATFTVGTVSESLPGVLTVPVTITSAGTFRLKVLGGAPLTDLQSNSLTADVLDDQTLTTDATPPIVIAITDDDADNIYHLSQIVTYTVTFSEDVNPSTVNQSDFRNAIVTGAASFTVGTLTQISAREYQVPVTISSGAAFQLQVSSSANIQDLRGNAVPGVVNDSDQMQFDTVAPSILDILDDDTDDRLFRGQTVNYIVQFSEDMNASTVTAADFTNGVTSEAATFTIGTVTETTTTSGRFVVPVTITSDGAFQLALHATAILEDLSGNQQPVSVQDGEVLTVDVIRPWVVSASANTAGPIRINDTVLYTLTFSEAMDLSTFSQADFANVGTAAFVVAPLTEVIPGTYILPVTAKSPGALVLQIPVSATLTDTTNNRLSVPVDLGIPLFVNPASTTPGNLVVNTSGTAATVGVSNTADPLELTFNFLSNGLQIVGANGTRVNGATSQFFAGVTSVAGNLGNGNDRVVVVGATSGSFHLDMSGGNNALTFNGFSGGTAGASTQFGGLNLNLLDSSFANLDFVGGVADLDSVTARNAIVSGNTSFNLRGGNNTLQISDSLFTGNFQVQSTGVSTVGVEAGTSNALGTRFKGTVNMIVGAGSTVRLSPTAAPSDVTNFEASVSINGLGTGANLIRRNAGFVVAPTLTNIFEQ